MQPSRTRSGFTLIELLTVISIIAILMGLLLPALNSAKNAAKKTQAKNDVTQFVTAVKAFYTDYGQYPVVSSVTTDTEYGASTDTYHNADIVNVLRADISGNASLGGGTGQTPTMINTKQVVYLDVPQAKDQTNPKTGLVSTGNSTFGYGEWIDPWGSPYIIAVDGNYDGYVGPFTATAVLNAYTDVGMYVKPNGTGNAVQTGCIAGSFGSDHVQGTASGSVGNKVFLGSDDVLSWQ